MGIFVGGAPVRADTPSKEGVFPHKNSIFVEDPELESAVASLFSGELGYTLIGEKPVSIQEGSNCYLKQHPDVVKRLFSFLSLAFNRSSRFILRISGKWDGCYDIELFNKDAFRRIVTKHHELQEFIRKKYVDINGFFPHTQHSEECVFELFNHNAFLLGLIFGYGRDNAEYYCRMNEVEMILKKHPSFSIFPNDLKPNVHRSSTISFFSLDTCEECFKRPRPKGKFDSLEAEWKWIQKVCWDLTDSCTPKPPYYIRLPFYICRHGGDSEQVRNNYTKAQNRLAKLFYTYSFTNAVIEVASREP